MPNGTCTCSLMKVETIGECSFFDLYKAIIGLEKQFSMVLGVAVLHRFYCTCNEVLLQIMQT